MAYNITTVLNDLSGVVHGTQITKVPNPYGLLNRTARALLLDVDPKETQRIVQIGQVFNDVFDYPLPADVKGDRVIDLRLPAGRMPWDVFSQGYAQNFDANKLVSFANKTYTQWNTGIKTFRIEAPTLSAPLVITDTGSLTGWSVTAGAQNLSLNSTNAPAGSGALQFDLAAGPTSGSVQINTLNPIDLTTRINIDTEFYWVYLPTASAFTSITLRWGSDYTTNYYSYTATLTQQGTAFQNGWNLIAAPWASATKTGSPVATAYDSVQVIYNYNGTLQTGVQFCNYTSNTGTIFQLQYYSKFLFRDPSTNAFQETVVDVTDNNKILNLDTESYNLFFNKAAYYIAQTLQGADAEYDANYWGGMDGQGGEYGNALKRYRALNPSEAIVKTEPYYRIRRGGSGYIGFARRGPNSGPP